MTEKSSNTEDNKKESVVKTADLNKVVPKLASRVFFGKVGHNTLLTFVADLGDGTFQVIETIAVDPSLHKGLLKLLEDDLSEQKKEGEE